MTFGAFRIGGDSFQKLYDTRLVETGRSLRVTRYLDFVPMLPNKSRYVCVRLVQFVDLAAASTRNFPHAATARWAAACS